MNRRSSLIHRVSRFIEENRLLTDGGTVIIGTSGGIDSTALLHILNSLPLKLTMVAVYVDHGLRPEESAAERNLIEQLASKLHIDSVIKEADTHAYRRKHKTSTEEAARILRYNALEEVRRAYPGSVIAVAHTADDQVEEFFLRLLRGTGMRGLSGMSCKREHIIRPLLNESKAELSKFLESIGQNYCHDSSNDSMSFLRNAVRLDLLPKLEKEYNPSLRSSMLQLMSVLMEDDDLLDSICMNRFEKLCSITEPDLPDHPAALLSLLCGDFLLEPISIQRRILEKCCWAMHSKPSYEIIEQLRHLAVCGENGSRLHLPKGLRCTRVRQKLVFEYPKGKLGFRGDESRTAMTSVTIQQPGRYEVTALKRVLTLNPASDIVPSAMQEGALCLDAEKLQFPLLLRPPLPGEKMKPAGGAGHKKILRILQDMKIPAAQRHLCPVLADSDGPVAIVGARIADRVKPTEETKQMLLLTWQDKNND